MRRNNIKAPVYAVYTGKSGGRKKKKRKKEYKEKSIILCCWQIVGKRILSIRNYNILFGKKINYL